ncbi:MAG: T9SS type A sorting domain-containing protein [Saprospiraceae bacterium]|nr:T9SS type A sorting domain-containing protein [Bacteroidia bacterium]NNK90570.1 T9SS type A sorting domain-containing protein [Saprospiraceae bacterium]
MKIKFTICSFFLAMLLTAGMYAQPINTMTVNGGAAAGEYTIALANFGDLSQTPSTGNLAFANDGMAIDSNADGSNTGTETDACEAITSDVAGDIAVVDRGECAFVVKAANAQAAGAVTMLICNNDTDNPDQLVIPGGDDPSITIRVVSMTLNDCQTVKMAMANETVNVTFSYVEPPCFTPEYGPEVIWGNERGQGDFEDGPNGWTINNDDSEGDGWAWVHPDSGFDIFGTTIGSATECNGYMHLDSWGLGNVNQGICDPCNGSIESPLIDLSGLAIDGLFVEFDQIFVQFFSATYVLASPDGGQTWPDTFQVNNQTIVNTFEAARTVKVALPGYENAGSIKLRFWKNSNPDSGYYYWGIDDVRLVNESSADMRANFNFFATAPAYKTPVGQASEMPFLIDIFNIGNVTATNVTCDVEIFGPDGTMVFQTTNNYPDIGAWSDNQNTVFPETFTPTEVGFYQGRYVVGADGDTNADNDVIPFNFEVTDNILSPLPAEDEFVTPPVFNSMTDGSTWSPGSSAFTLNYAAGHMFYVPNGTDHTITKVRFGVDDEQTRNGTVNVWLYAWLRNDEDNSGSFTIEADNTLLVGAKVGGGQIINPAFGSQRQIEIEMAAADLSTGEALLDNDGNPIPVELRDDQMYVMVFATNSNNATQIGLLGFDTDSPFVEERNWNVSAANLALDSLGSNRLTGTAMAQTSTGNFNEIDGLTFTGGTWGINELWVEYTIEEITSGTEDLNNTQDITVYPNPATEIVFVDLQLETASPVSIDVVDIKGTLIKSLRYDNIINEKVSIDVRDLNAGMYHINVRTEEGFTSKRIVVSK